MYEQSHEICFSLYLIICALMSPSSVAKKVVILAKHLVTTVACMTILTLQMIAVLENIHAVGADT